MRPAQLQFLGKAVGSGTVAGQETIAVIEVPAAKGCDGLVVEGYAE